MTVDKTWNERRIGTIDHNSPAPPLLVDARCNGRDRRSLDQHLTPGRRADLTRPDGAVGEQQSAPIVAHEPLLSPTRPSHSGTS